MSSEAELEKLAIAALVKEAKCGALKAKHGGSTSWLPANEDNKPKVNKRFLKNSLTSTLRSSSLERERRYKRAQRKILELDRLDEEYQNSKQSSGVRKSSKDRVFNCHDKSYCRSDHQSESLVRQYRDGDRKRSRSQSPGINKMKHRSYKTELQNGSHELCNTPDKSSCHRSKHSRTFMNGCNKEEISINYDNRSLGLTLNDSPKQNVKSKGRHKSKKINKKKDCRE